MINSGFKGRQAEYLFASKCAERGLLIGFPSVESIPFDFYVSNSYQDFKVQVKGSYAGLKDRKGYRISLTRTRNAPKRENPIYKINDFEILVAFIDPLKEWFIIPHKDFVSATSLSFYPKGYTPRYKKIKFNTDKYREAWHLLENYGRKEET